MISPGIHFLPVAAIAFSNPSDLNPKQEIPRGPCREEGYFVSAFVCVPGHWKTGLQSCEHNTEKDVLDHQIQSLRGASAASPCPFWTLIQLCLKPNNVICPPKSSFVSKFLLVVTSLLISSLCLFMRS